MLKKVMTILTVVLITVLSAITVSANNTNYETEEIEWKESGIKMAVDGKEITFPDQKPLLDAQAGRTYIPIRFLAEALGADVEWINEHQVVEIVNKGIEGENTKNVYFLKIGSNKIVKASYDEGGNIASVVSVFCMPENIVPVLEGGRTVIPFRYIAELMGAQVYYDPVTHTANCVKRDLTQYKKDQYGGAIPVLNSLIGEYFVDELNKFRASYGYAPVTLNGDYSDMMTWACFDQITNPNQYEYYVNHFGETGMHMFSWNRNTDVNSRLQPNETNSQKEMDYGVWHVGAYYQYIRTYLPNHPVYGVFDRDKKLAYWQQNYGENGYVSDSHMGSKVRNDDLSAEVYDELTTYWGLKIDTVDNSIYQLIDGKMVALPGPKNGEYRTVSIYGEATMRNIAKNAINTWNHSQGHRQMMLNPYLKEVGFATVGEFTYMCGLR